MRVVGARWARGIVLCSIGDFSGRKRGPVCSETYPRAEEAWSVKKLGY